MIGFLRGIVDSVELNQCFLDVQGVGYQVGITYRAGATLHVGNEVKLYTHLAIREDDMSLYGFSTPAELASFKVLIGVSGIGAKVAMAILSDIQVDELALAIAQKDLARLTKISGIGKKTAERMLLELKDKMGTGEGLDLSLASDSFGVIEDFSSPVIEVLRSLGYQTQEIMKVLGKVEIQGLSESDAVKLVLKEISKGR
ncbi:MAG: Holliday junction branch migration protein RuvA [Negativicutes bacterium]|nr:Holliday junction branch migration protein RuvA [Negativicutes bacterium]